MKMSGGVEIHLHHSWPRHEMKLSCQFHALVALSHVKDLPVTIRQELDGPQSRFGRRGEAENLSSLPGIESLPSTT